MATEFQIFEKKNFVEDVISFNFITIEIEMAE